jgi:hypothetical protein
MRWRSILAIAGLLVASGCAGHAGTMRGVRAALVHNDLDEARARLAEAGRGTDDLLFALEDGLLLHYAGDAETSNARFEFAERRVDELYTKSISRAALSLVTSDLVLKFEPRGIENFLVNYFRALNYLELGEPEEALVEWRKLNSKLQFSRAQGDAPQLDPPFFHHLAGLGLEADDPGDAYVALRLAEAACLERGERPPPDLVTDLVRLATRLGLADHLQEYRTRYPALAPGDTAGGASPSEPPQGTRPGEIVVLIEDGLVAAIEELSVYLPITRERALSVYGGNEDDRLAVAWLLARDYDRGHYSDARSGRVVSGEVAYVLPLSFPVFGQAEPAFAEASAAVGTDAVAARIALDVSALQRSAFQDRLLAIYAKTIARALFKWAAAAELKEVAEEEGGETAGEIVGFLANAINAATERADTRAWLGLPDRIWIARLTVPPGRHSVTLYLRPLGEVSLGPVDVRPGERRFVSHRAF